MTDHLSLIYCLLYHPTLPLSLSLSLSRLGFLFYPDQQLSVHLISGRSSVLFSPVMRPSQRVTRQRAAL